MALLRESLDLDWLKGIADLLRARLNVLGRCLLTRLCFMERMQGEDLSFGTKNAFKELKDARGRLQSHLTTIEGRMTTLILCDYDDQNPVAGLSAQILSRVDKTCFHHGEGPGHEYHKGFALPIARRHHRQVAKKGVVDTYLENERLRLQKYLLARLGIHVFGAAEETLLIADWNSLVDHERAHIAAAYFRRIVFNEPQLFIVAHYHTCSFKERTIDLPTIMTPKGQDLDLAKDIDGSILCMITFLLSSSLHITHLALLYDYTTCPAYLEVRTAVQDVILDIQSFEEANGKPGPPNWAHPIRRDIIDNRVDPGGTVPVLCGTLYEVSYFQATDEDSFEPRFWSHIASLVRCGECLFAMVYNSGQWCDLVRIFAAHRVPLYDRIFPQIVGSAPGNLWSIDRVSDDVRGQNFSDDECHGGRVACKYRLDELLELAGVTMLGIIEGGPIDTKGITDAGSEKFMQTVIFLPQIWFALPTYDPATSAILRELLARSCLPDATFTFAATIPDDPALTRAIRKAPQHVNVLQLFNVLKLQTNGPVRWQPARFDLPGIHLLARLKHDPVPSRIESGMCLVEIAYNIPKAVGIEPILDLLLDIYMSVHRADSPDTLARKLENTLEHGFNMANRDHTGAFTYAFDCARIKPLLAGSNDGLPASEDELGGEDEVRSQGSPPTFGSPTLSHGPSSATSSPSCVPAAMLDTQVPNISVAPLPPTKRVDWFDLEMTTEPDSLPDLSDWGVTLPT
ncbi:hypothetical protein FRC08_014072 [Ceratobasidium sp. 394]|nr:hypothetical protein FRC08_014072 [Ceratobasidium sp. 394]